MAYDIRKIKEYGMSKAQWGREYYAKDAMGWLVPVLFLPYFNWENCGQRVIAGPNKGKPVDTPLSVITRGVRQVLEDLPRILRKEWYHDED